MFGAGVSSAAEPRLAPISLRLIAGLLATRLVGFGGGQFSLLSAFRGRDSSSTVPRASPSIMAGRMNASRSLLGCVMGREILGGRGEPLSAPVGHLDALEAHGIASCVASACTACLGGHRPDKTTWVCSDGSSLPARSLRGRRRRWGGQNHCQ